jgi:protease-4
VILRIDSPGGSTAGSEAIYEALIKIGKKKPIVAVMDTVAASGGYITAIASDHIVARGNTITGSIGVIFQFPEVSRLLDTLGVKMEEIKSGELKAEPNPYKPMSDKARSVANEMVQDSFGWFTGLVAERRQIPLSRVLVLSDGRVYTGRQALKENLIDEIGGEERAIAWLTEEKKLPSDLPVLDWAPKRTDELSSLGFSVAAKVMTAIGLGHFVPLTERPQLDGLLAVWHPSS